MDSGMTAGIGQALLFVAIVLGLLCFGLGFLLGWLV